MHGGRIKTIQSKLDQCESGSQVVVTTKKELDLCRDELSDEQKSKEDLKRNVKTLQNDNDKLQKQLTSKNDEIENLRNRIRGLESEKNRIQSESSKNQREAANKIRNLTSENTKLQKTISSRPKITNSRVSVTNTGQKMICQGPIVGSNGLTLLKKQSEIGFCQENGIYDEPEKSLLIFDDDAKDGANERAIITQGLSTHLDKTDEKYKIGNKDKIITSFNTNGNVKYQFNGACGVTYKGLIHFFGGLGDYRNQHFGFDEKRNFVKYKNLEMYILVPQCSTFKISKSNSQSGDKEVVLICFDAYHRKNCYQYDDDELTHFADANEDHYSARLGKYKDQLITVGYWYNEKTEILDRSYNGVYKWTLGPNYNFSPTGKIYQYSMVNVPQMGFNEEYLLLIGGYDGSGSGGYIDKVHKFNGKWSFFGNLQKTRAYHGSVFLNGRVFIIGGFENYDNRWMKTETWDSSKSRFETEPTWPELNSWYTDSNHVFIIPDYTNP